jgi:hypothetical protein
MHSNKLDRWLTIGTNISVLIGIILLTVEIDQNDELVRIQIEQVNVVSMSPVCRFCQNRHPSFMVTPPARQLT